MPFGRSLHPTSWTDAVGGEVDRLVLHVQVTIAARKVWTGFLPSASGRDLMDAWGCGASRSFATPKVSWFLPPCFKVPVGATDDAGRWDARR